MVKDKSTIISDIEAHIASSGGSYSEWYVGITNDGDRRVFVEHKVNKDTDKFIICPTDSSDTAREVEDYFTNGKKTDGNPGGGDNSLCL